MKGISLTIITAFLLAATAASAAETKLGPNTGDNAMKAAIAKLGKSLFIVPKTEAAAEELVAVGECILPYLVGKLETSASDTEQTLAACALGKLGDLGAFEPLRAALINDDSTAVRMYSARALADLGDGRAVPVLIKRLTDEKDSRVYRFVCYSLGTLKAADAVTALSKALDSGVTAAATALGQIADASAFPALKRGLYSDTELVSLEAAKALASFEDQAARDILLEAAKDKNWNASKSSAVVLGEKKDSAAVTPLCESLSKSDSIEVRIAAVQALGKIGDAKAEGSIITALTSDSSQKVRAMAAWSLGELGKTGYVSNLTAALGDDSAMVREAARVALAENFAAAAVPALSEILKSDSATLRVEVVNTLARIATPESKAALETAASDSDESVRDAAKTALKSFESR
ncbi:MAG: HEAT repeat domain-containing protein [Planctomycetota bacterium]|jgi:HEAT repeat protein